VHSLSARLPRRALLRLVTGVAASAACGPAERGSSPCASAGAGPGLGYCLVQNKRLRVPGGALVGVGQGILIVLDDATAGILARDGKGLYALSATCTHACCTVNLCASAACATPVVTPAACDNHPAATTLASSGPAFLCPCHGSTYAADGTVLKGPAMRSLPSVVVEIDGTDALVDLSRPADPSTRV
jgi:Rieske Fe-S protein